MEPIVISLTEQDYKLLIKAIQSSILYAETGKGDEELKGKAAALSSFYYRLECGFMDYNPEEGR